MGGRETKGVKRERRRHRGWENKRVIEGRSHTERERKKERESRGLNECG